MGNTVIERRSLSEQVVGHVKNMILAGEYGAGERIPEERIAEELGVSRTPIREALRKLSEYGLVIVTPRIGATVAVVTEDDAKHITVVRAELEGLAGKLLAMRITDDQMAQLERLYEECSEYAEQGSVAATFQADSEFHLKIASLTGNAFLYDCLDRLDARVQLLRVVYCSTHERISSAVKEHAAIMEALKARDGERVSQLLMDHSVHYHLTKSEARK